MLFRSPSAGIYDIRPVLARDSEYLSEHVSFRPESFRLEPNEKQNIDLEITVPDDISPEEHILTVNFLSVDTRLGSFQAKFSVPGERISELRLDSVDAHVSDELIYFDFALQNTGNVIARGSPSVEIYSGEMLVDSLGEESNVMVLPDKGYNFSLMYDSANAEPGTYTYKASFVYDSKETVTAEGDFTVKKTEHDEGPAQTVMASQGEKARIIEPVDGEEDGISFYRIEYEILGQRIEGSAEGQVGSSGKDVAVHIDSKDLAQGSYDMAVRIYSGDELENIREKRYVLKIRDRMSMIWFLVPLPLLAIGLFFLYRRTTYARERQLDKAVSRISGDFGRLEGNVNSLTRELKQFITESNHWLDQRGYSNYGFR
mgnify:CR=1 FL=1